MQGSARSQEIHLRTKAGQVMVILLSVELIELGGNQCLLTVGQDISDRKRAEDQLQQLSGRLLRLQDEERRRIARHLHDSTGQNLAVLAMSLRQLYGLIPASGRKLRKLVAQCQVSTEGCMREVRSLSYVLHPPMLDQAGLEDAIRHYAAGFTERTGIEIELEVSPGIARLQRDRELAFFRVIQECLINIHRHSGSQTASIHLLTKPGLLSLEVRDNGCGIRGREVTHAGEIPAIFGVGIPSMSERVKEHGGWLDIETNGGGTTVRVTIPTHD
jgi:signal transduction histidine kinase